MQDYADKKQENLSSKVKKDTSKIFTDNNSAVQHLGNSPEVMHQQPIQRTENNTGLPDSLKTGVESLSGYSLNDVSVHYNSQKPAQLNAHAYAQGTDIHVAPGQEKHLAHESWHVVQQKQGRVKPTMQMKGNVNINDDVGLEKEADMMGAKALQIKSRENIKPESSEFEGMRSDSIQRAIRTNDTQYSFQSIFDENGNPFLKEYDTNKEEGYAKISQDQPDLAVDNIEYDDTYLDTTDEVTLDKIKNNIEKYRSVNVKSGDVKGVMVSSKSYLFKGGTRPDVALYDKGGATPSKYTDFYKEAYDDINELVTCYKDDDFSIDAVNDIWNNYMCSFQKMTSQKTLVIIAEEYRVPGARDKNEGLDIACFDAVEAYKNKCIEMITNDDIIEVELIDLEINAMTAYKKCTKDLPWAGSGGKKSFLKDRINDLNDLGISDEDINEQLHLERDDYYPFDIGSPMIDREPNSDDEV